MKKGFTSIAFIIIGFCLFNYVQTILAFKWSDYRQFGEAPKLSFREYDELRGKGDIPAFFVGTSHVGVSVDPMQIYRDYGIAAFNLFSSAQPIEGTYFLVKKAIEEFQPKIIFFDVSGLFADQREDYRFHLLLDNMPFSIDKLRFAAEYAKSRNDADTIERFLDGLFPFLTYHSRWNELRDYDFQNNNNYNLFLKGFAFDTRISSALISTQDMNTVAYRNKYNVGFTNIESKNLKWSETILTPLYDPHISENNIRYLEMIISLCAENGIRLTLIKIPSINYPQFVASGWTEIKSDMVKQLAAKYELPFIDLLYDYDLGLDLKTDSPDGGFHLNHNGAMKVSDFFGNYLNNRPEIEKMPNEEYEKDLPIYEKALKIGNLQSVLYFTDYLQVLKNLSGKTILLSAADDMRENLDETDIILLRALGLRTDFREMNLNNAYLAVIKDGNVEYEAVSNRSVAYETTIGNQKPCKLTSSSWDVEHRSEIIIDGKNVSIGTQGINIVVFDDESGLVLDSVSFDTCVQNDPPGKRNEWNTFAYFNEYKNYLMSQDFEKGIY